MNETRKATDAGKRVGLVVLETPCLSLHPTNLFAVSPRCQSRLRCNLRNSAVPWHFVQATRFDVILVTVDLEPQLSRLGVDNAAHAVRRPQGLMLLQAVPRVHGDAVVPPDAKLRDPTVLRVELDGRHGLEREFLLVPLDADVVDGLLVKVLQKLRAKSVRDFVLPVEVAQFLRDHIDWVCVLDVLLFQGLLRLTFREDGEFGHIVAVPVCRL